MKTKADNNRLFEEARILKQKLRSDLHNRATNTYRFVVERKTEIRVEAESNDKTIRYGG